MFVMATHETGQLDAMTIFALLKSHDWIICIHWAAVWITSLSTIDYTAILNYMTASNRSN
jgi:hypothetical protein